MQVHCFDMFNLLSDKGSDCQNTSVQVNKRSVCKIVIIFLTHQFNLCFRCSKDESFEYPQHMFLLRNKKNLYL